MYQDVILIRHGESVMNVAVANALVAQKRGDQDTVRTIFEDFNNRYTHYNCPLTQTGEQQASYTAEILRSEGIVPFRFYSSDMTRAVQTAYIIAKKLGLHVPPILSRRYRERDYGVYDRRVERVFEREEHTLFEFNPPEGESVNAIYDRADRIVGCLRERRPTHAGPNHSGGPIVIASHFEIMLWIRAVIEGWSTLTHKNRLTHEHGPKNGEMWHYRFSDTDVQWRRSQGGATFSEWEEVVHTHVTWEMLKALFK